MTKAVADIDIEGFAVLAEEFWPGALTIIVPAAGGIAETVVAGGPSVGVRAPDDLVTLQLLEHYGPIAATSANLSGDPPAETVDDLDTELVEGVSVIVDAGPCPLGRASTVIDLTLPEPTILREGPISREQLQDALGRPVRFPEIDTTEDG
jgi:tRNA threonylcarbamoyl adenosine modification protein (Sua5/YciO/YrdC/YwlC family)